MVEVVETNSIEDVSERISGISCDDCDSEAEKHIIFKETDDPRRRFHKYFCSNYEEHLEEN